MLSKAEIKVLRYIHKQGKDTVIDSSHPPFKLSSIRNLSDVLDSLRQKTLIEEIGAKDIKAIPHRKVGAILPEEI